MVAERVEVLSKKSDSDAAFCQASDGKTGFTISPADKQDTGTAITLFLKSDAKEFLEEEEKEIASKVQELGIEEDLANHKGLTLGMLLTLGEENIKTLKDFAELSTDEIIGGYDEIKKKKKKFDGILEEFSISRKDAEDLIMRARKKVFNF